LRERPDDIPLLLRTFLQKAAEELGVPSKTMTSEFELYVSQLQWPGNVRQLQNTAHWLTVMAAGSELMISDLPGELEGPREETDSEWESAFRRWVNTQLRAGETNILGKSTPAMERILIECALIRTRDRRQEAAKLLGWGRNTLTRKIRELEL